MCETRNSSSFTQPKFNDCELTISKFPSLCFQVPFEWVLYRFLTRGHCKVKEKILNVASFLKVVFCKTVDGKDYEEIMLIEFEDLETFPLINICVFLHAYSYLKRAVLEDTSLVMYSNWKLGDAKGR